MTAIQERRTVSPHSVFIQRFLLTREGAARLFDRGEAERVTQLRLARRATTTFGMDSTEMTGLASQLISLLGGRNRALAERMGPVQVSRVRRGAKLLLETEGMVNFNVVDRSEVARVYLQTVRSQNSNSSSSAILGLAEVGTTLIPLLFTNRGEYRATEEAWRRVLELSKGTPLHIELAARLLDHRRRFDRSGKLRIEPVALGTYPGQLEEIVDLHNRKTSLEAIARSVELTTSDVAEALRLAKEMGYPTRRGRVREKKTS